MVRNMELIIRRRNGDEYTVLFDAEDEAFVRSHSWHIVPNHDRIYVRSGGQGYQYLHRLLVPNCPTVDHINGNGLDNRRANLRPATKAQQTMNRRRRSDNQTSRFKGVRHLPSQKWSARITLRGQEISLGTFLSEEEAARAYNEAACRYFGEFALLNLFD